MDMAIRMLVQWFKLCLPCLRVSGQRCACNVVLTFSVSVVIVIPSQSDCHPDYWGIIIYDIIF
jgi:hypothetical protein